MPYTRRIREAFQCRKLKRPDSTRGVLGIGTVNSDTAGMDNGHEQVGDRHAPAYLIARVLSALANAGAVAVFTRLAPASVYGQYLIGFAVCFIIYGFSLQWVTFAHFGNYSRRDADKLAGSVLAISAALLLPAFAVIAGLVWVGVLDPNIAPATGFLLFCFMLHFTALEIARSHLMVRTFVTATITRSLLALVLGTLTLTRFQSAGALLTAVGLAYALGSLPVFLRLPKAVWIIGFVRPSRETIARLLTFGWPLIIAVGATAAALNVDRIILERLRDAAAVAPYGAVLDLMKQTFLVVAESITVGYVPFARTLHSEGHGEEARLVLKRAFVTQSYLVVFGIVFFALLGDLVFSVLLAPSYVPVAMEILPILLIGNAILVMRAYYFGQVIYFNASAFLELAAAIAMLAVAAASTIALVPHFGVVGAAVGFSLGQAAALLVFVAGTPRSLRLPLDWSRAGILVAVGIAVFVAGTALRATEPRALAAVVNLILISLTSAYFLFRWNLFNAWAIAHRMRALVGRRNDAE